jgi:hypothetical protein
MLGQLIKQVQFQRWIDTLVTAGVDASLVESSVIDCAGYDRMLVTMDVGATATQNGTIKFYLEECATSDGTYAALSGATIGTHTHGASGEAKKTYIIDAKLSKRYVKIAYQRETQNSTIDSGIYLLYNNKMVPEAQTTDVKELVVT